MLRLRIVFPFGLAAIAGIFFALLFYHRFIDFIWSFISLGVNTPQGVGMVVLVIGVLLFGLAISVIVRLIIAVLENKQKMSWLIIFTTFAGGIVGTYGLSFLSTGIFVLALYTISSIFRIPVR